MRGRNARPTLTPASGIELVTGKCQPCRTGHHLECRSLEDSPQTYPYFDAEDGPPDGGSGWECPCLTYSTDRGLDVHGTGA